MYSLLNESGLEFSYEPKSFVLLEGFYPKNEWYEGQKPRKDKIRSITYTPDFIVVYQDIQFVIEVKGFITDRYPLKRKLLLDKINKEGLNIIFFELHTKKDMTECIERIHKIIDAYENSCRENKINDK